MPDKPQPLSPLQQRRARENLDELAGNARGVRNALLVSADGLLIHRTGEMDQAKAESLAAVTSSLLGAARGTGEVIGEGPCEQMMARYASSTLIFTAVTDLAGLLVLVDRGTRLDVIAAAITRLVESTGRVLAPQVREDIAAGPPAQGHRP
ncbi:MAG: roadblock/LC7 domain-containing protein [Actinoallomurus sp.]